MVILFFLFFLVLVILFFLFFLVLVILFFGFFVFLVLVLLVFCFFWSFFGFGHLGFFGMCEKSLKSARSQWPVLKFITSSHAQHYIAVGVGGTSKLEVCTSKVEVNMFLGN